MPEPSTSTEAGSEEKRYGTLYGYHAGSPCIRRGWLATNCGEKLSITWYQAALVVSARATTSPLASFSDDNESFWYGDQNTCGSAVRIVVRNPAVRTQVPANIANGFGRCKKTKRRRVAATRNQTVGD